MTLVQAHSDLHSLLTTLRQREAIFRQARVSYSSARGSGELHRFVSVHWPGRSALYSVTPQGESFKCAFNEGRSWAYVTSPTGAPQLAYEYGTLRSGYVNEVKNKISQDLYAAGIMTAGGLFLSDFLKRSVSVTPITGTPNGWHIVPPPGTYPNSKESLDLLISRKQDHLFTKLIFKKGPSDWAYYVADTSTKGLGWGKTIASNLGAERLIERVTFSGVQQLQLPPSPFVPSRGTVYIDGPHQAARVWGDTVQFDSTEGRAVLSTALASHASRRNEPALEGDCGIEALWYGLQVLGKRNASLPHPEGSYYLTSLAMLKRLAATAGIHSKLVYSEKKNFTELSLPAILSVRPSHFILLLNRNGQVIDPPYSTFRLSPAELAQGWSGYALELGP